MARKTKRLFTIGYEQAKPDAVLRELKRAKVKLVVDTRAVAASRRAGLLQAPARRFARRGRHRLSASAETGHAGGRPAGGARRRSRRALRIYDKHIKTPEAQAALAELIALIKSGQRIALLCYCRNPKACHRARIVANVKQRMHVKAEDLIPAIF